MTNEREREEMKESKRKERREGVQGRGCTRNERVKKYKRRKLTCALQVTWAAPQSTVETHKTVLCSLPRLAGDLSVAD